jgi:streptogramin lyase
VPAETRVGEAMIGKTTVRLLALAAVALGLVGAGEARAASGPVTEFPMPKGAGMLAAGPDGAVWFARAGVLGRIAADGKVDELALPEQTGYPQDIALGPEGDFWITTSTEIDRVNTSGSMSRFPLPGVEKAPGKIAVGADGNLWFTLWVPVRKVAGVEERFGNAYAVRITPSGQMTRFKLPGPAKERNFAPGGIAAGPDGNLWFTDPSLGRIGKLSPVTGAITEYDLDVAPYAIVAGPDGNLWFTSGGGIGRISPVGKVRMFPHSGGGSRIVAGSDGNIWFSGSGLAVTRITPAGQVTSFGAAGGADILDIVAGPDGGIWVSTTTSPIKFIVTAPVSRISTGVSGVDVISTSAIVRGGRVAIELACGGSAKPCRGELTIGGGKQQLAAGAYSVAAESSGVVGLPLSASARRKLTRLRFLRESVYATVDGGVGSSSKVVLQRPHPLRGVPRPGHVQLMPLPSDRGGWDIARGPDGNLWLSGAVGSLTRVTPSGRLSLVRVPGFERATGAIVAGPGRSMWFLESRPGIGLPRYLLGRISPAGGHSEIALPEGLYAEDLAVGADGALWVSRYSPEGSEIDRVTPGGKVRRFPVGDEPGAITAGPGGAVWFGFRGPAIGRITRTGKVKTFRVPGRGFVGGITEGPDRNLWYTHWGRRGPPTIGRMTPGGQVAEFPLHARGRPGSVVLGQIIAGPDDNLWFAEELPNRIGRITPRGKITQWRRGAAAAGRMTVGPRGNLWLVEGAQQMVGIMSPGRGYR